MRVTENDIGPFSCGASSSNGEVNRIIGKREIGKCIETPAKRKKREKLKVVKMKRT
ncbi:glutamate-gated chloride channel isoform X1 [Sesbania bispinosa]|nr:glutamate-gated chloride channel isoform X1 [Sesbania bispinosa]